jgi:hypothetical protein
VTFKRPILYAGTRSLAVGDCWNQVAEAGIVQATLLLSVDTVNGEGSKSNRTSRNSASAPPPSLVNSAKRRATRRENG